MSITLLFLQNQNVKKQITYLTCYCMLLNLKKVWKQNKQHRQTDIHTPRCGWITRLHYILFQVQTQPGSLLITSVLGCKSVRHAKHTLIQVAGHKPTSAAQQGVESSGSGVGMECVCSEREENKLSCAHFYTVYSQCIVNTSTVAAVSTRLLIINNISAPV